MKKVMVLLAGMLTAGFLAGCNGGGGDSDDILPGGGPGSGGGDNPNGALTGRVFYMDKFDPYVIDLATSERTNYPYIRHNRYGTQKIAARPRMDGREVVQVDYSGEGEVVTVSIRDADGRTLSRFTIPRTLDVDVKLSPDGRWVAARWANHTEEGEGAETRFTLFSRDGSRREQPFGNLGIHTFDWLPDGGLAYAVGRTIYVTDPGWGQSIEVITLPRGEKWNREGFPFGLASSHDGQKFAFRLLQPESRPDLTLDHYDIWVVNRDGSGLRQVTRDSRPGSAGEHDPAWSPDGRWLVAPSGARPPRAPGQGWRDKRCAKLYFFPADATQLDPLDRVLYYRYSSDVYAESCTLNSLMWAPPLPPGDPGSLPKENGLPNRGLTGTLYYHLRRGGSHSRSKLWDPWALDLATGRQTRLPDTILAASASPDGREFAFTTTEGEGENKRAVVVIVDRDGREVSRFSRPYALDGAVKFSPDGQRLAFWMSPSTKPGEWADEEGILVTTRDGTELVFDPPGQSTTFDWLSDTELVLGREDGFYRADIQTGDVTRLFALFDKVLGLRVSPDGQRLAFRLGQRVWVSDLNGDNLRRLTESNGIEFGPQWSPDGRYLLLQYSGFRNDEFTVWVVAADARAVRIGNAERHRNGFPVRLMGDDGNLQILEYPSMTPVWR